MKRCNVCGNVGQDSNTYCEACGAPYADTETSAVQRKPAEAEETQKADAPEAKKRVRTNGTAEQRRGGGNPRIYGQAAVPDGQDYPQQGMFRRNVTGSQMNAQQAGSQSRGMNPQQAGSQSRGVNPQQAGSQSRGMNPQQAGSQSRGINPQMQGGQSRGVNPQQAGGQSRGMNPQMQGGQSRGMNPQQAGGQSRGINPQMQGGQSRGMNPQQAGSQSRGMNPQMQASGQNRGMNSQLPVSRGRGMNPQMQGRQTMVSAQRSRMLIEASRACLKSPLLLLAVLFNTIALAGNIASIFMNQLNYSQIATLIQRISLPSQLAGYVGTVTSLLSKLDSGLVLVNLLIQLPAFIFCLGLWVIFLSAAIAKENMSSLGFTLTKIDIIIEMIVSFLVFAAVLIINVAIVVSAWVSSNNAMMIVSAIVLVLMITCTMMIIMYYFSFLATLKTCRLNSTVGENYGSVSSYVAVIHIITGLFSAMGLLSGIVNGEIAAIASSAGTIVWQILFGIWIFNYKGSTEEFQEQ